MNTHAFPKQFDLVIVGAGHAGCEAAMAAARLGLNTLLLTGNVDRIGHLSCNPAIGGVGKGHMVREIDALGGAMGRWADEAGIQFRTLNAGKGPAVRATRAQMDRARYMRAVQRDLYARENLWIFQDQAAGLRRAGDGKGRVDGVYTEQGAFFSTRAALLATGTFLSGRIHVGSWRMDAGRAGDAPSKVLAQSLKDLGLDLGRLMTCTTPRIFKDSIDFSRLAIQTGDDPAPRFSFHDTPPLLPQLACHIAYTNPASHRIIADNLLLSPMYNGVIDQPGPRYCPSIEDKIARFPDRERHQMFIEPEGLDSPEYYPNGMPTGLPLAVQEAFLRSIKGLEHCRILRAGYAVEYDFIKPTQLDGGLQVKSIPGLWCAGQINGSSGYEEAAAQGLWAALDVFLTLHGRRADPEYAMPGRAAAYMAVLVDDLVTKGAEEPYRMFTSRAEHRLLLREDNADYRLSAFGRKLGLVGDAAWAACQAKWAAVDELTNELENRHIRPDAATRDFFAAIGESAPVKPLSLAEILRRPALNIQSIIPLWPEIAHYPPAIRQEAETAAKYAGYIQRQTEIAGRQDLLEQVRLPANLDYSKVHGLNSEAIEKLTTIRPATLGQAHRVSGVDLSAICCIEIYLKKGQLRARHEARAEGRGQ